jgi:4-hydroxy-tetrahydrodipicolinate synthase
MQARPEFKVGGVIPACLLPFDADYSIDERSYRKHLRDVAGVRGITAITVNGHASEVSSCNFEEQEQILALTMDEVGDKVPVINGVYADGSLEAARIAKMSERGGASALLVFPPGPFSKGVQVRGEMALTHYRHVAAATSLPLIIFQYPMASGMGYRHETLQRLIEEIPSICAMKDNCSEASYHEQTIRMFQHGGPRPFTVLTTHSSWLLSSLVLGCGGILSGSGSTVADLQVALWDAVQRKDIELAQSIADRIYHWTRVIYTPAPYADAHNRMKEAQVLLGRLPSAVVRPPLCKIPDAEIKRIAEGLEAAGVRPHGAERAAA